MSNLASMSRNEPIAERWKVDTGYFGVFRCVWILRFPNEAFVAETSTLLAVSAHGMGGSCLADSATQNIGRRFSFPSPVGLARP